MSTLGVVEYEASEERGMLLYWYKKFTYFSKILEIHSRAFLQQADRFILHFFASPTSIFDHV